MPAYKFLPIAFVALMASACAALTNPDTAPTFTSTDAQVLAKNFANGATNGANAGNQQSRSAGTAQPFSAALGSLLQPRQVSCNSTGSSCQLFQQYSQTTTCNGGGRLTSSGIISGTISVGTLGAFGNISMQQTDSIVDWACEGGWTVNGDPNLTDTGTIAITGNHSSFSFRQGGSYTATSTTGGARVTCSQNVSVLWDNTALGGSYSGTTTCNPGGTFSVSGSF